MFESSFVRCSNVRYVKNFRMFDVRLFAKVQKFGCSNVRSFAEIEIFESSNVRMFFIFVRGPVFVRSNDRRT